MIFQHDLTHGQLECVLYLLKVNDTCDKTEIQLLNTSVK